MIEVLFVIESILLPTIEKKYKQKRIILEDITITYKQIGK